jgi:WD40 repeat protein
MNVSYARLRLLGLIFLALPTIRVLAQGTNMDYDKIQVGDAMHLFSGIDLSPDGQAVFISGNQGFPACLFDYRNKQVLRQYDAGNWYAGSKVTFSSQGRYVLLQQLFYLDWNLNKDREVSFEVVEVATGRSALKLDGYHDVALTPDERYAVSLSGSEVAFWDLGSGIKTRSYPVREASNAIAVTSDGKYIAVSQKPSDEYLKLRFKKNSKAIKFHKKYKNQIILYDSETFKQVRMIEDFFDIIYRMEFTPDDSYLFVLNIPHTSVQSRQNFINRVSMADYSLAREIIPAVTYYESKFELSPDWRYFAVSANGKFPEVHIYDFETNAMLYRFELTNRIFENMGKGEFPADGRAAFTFLPDSRSILITFGNRLILWRFEN